MIQRTGALYIKVGQAATPAEAFFMILASVQRIGRGKVAQIDVRLLCGLTYFRKRFSKDILKSLISP